ncbi:hypothetical protein ACIBLA_06265 [Streptomyces sp. NPDC050433]|uniref:hypothetical protein n=1 Tax=Streptomyces sp. NPDC050433 TaxID=3365615 RepID=UPI003794E7C4
MTAAEEPHSLIVTGMPGAGKSTVTGLVATSALTPEETADRMVRETRDRASVN